VKKKYFGTDGIRGKVGNSPITAEFFVKLGYAAGVVLSRINKRSKKPTGNHRKRYSDFRLHA
jgi:phosphoglucosamine mutase